MRLKHKSLFMKLTKAELAATIDSTLLRPESSYSDNERLCLDAIKFGFAAVCILPCYTEFCRDIIKDSSVKLCSVVGFPLGSNLISTKIEEVESLMEQGCNEVDMVINFPALFNKNYSFVREEIETICEICHSGNTLLKVIIETSLLSREQKIILCEIISDSGADFIKTSTGFAKSGAEIDDIILFKRHISDKVRIKASGGIRDFNSAIMFIEAGAARIGTSSGVNIINESSLDTNS